MRKLLFSLSMLSVFSLTGCANSRLRKDFVAIFQSDWPARNSPFAEKCDKAGNKVADGVNKVGSKFDDMPIEDRSHKLKEKADSTMDKAEDKTKSGLDTVKKEADKAPDAIKSGANKLEKKAEDVKHWWLS